MYELSKASANHKTLCKIYTGMTYLIRNPIIIGDRKFISKTNLEQNKPTGEHTQNRYQQQGNPSYKNAQKSIRHLVPNLDIP